MREGERGRRREGGEGAREEGEEAASWGEGGMERVGEGEDARKRKG